MNAFRRPSLLAWILLLAGLVLFVSLGRWQHGRAEFKREQIERWTEAQQMQAVALAMDSRHYQRVTASGRFLSQRYLLDNQIREGRAGVEDFVVFEGDQGRFLIALGWLAYADGTRVPPELPALPDGSVRLRGFWVPPPAHGIRMGRGWPQVPGYPKLMPYFALHEIAADAGLDLADGVLRLESDPDQPHVRDWRPVESMPPERHLAYAWQWWSLAAAIVVVFLVVHFKRSRRS